MLSISDVDTGYGNKQILHNVSLDFSKGETILLVGPNGSGKSTLLNLIVNRIRLWNKNKGASITYFGEDLTGKKTSEFIKLGIVYIPQKDTLFDDFSVAENLKASLLWDKSRILEKRMTEVVEQIPQLDELVDEKAATLSGGERKLVSLGMALMNRPRLLMYDEPLAGVSTDNVELVIRCLQTFKSSETCLLLIEHRIREILSLATKVVGMKQGRTTLQNLDDLESIKEFMV